MRIISIFFWLSIVVCSAYCSKFLAVSFNSRSHYFAMKKIAEELAQRGHEVILLAFETKDQQEKTHRNLKIMTCAGTDKIGLFEHLQLQLLKNKSGFLETIHAVEKINTQMCECIFNDTELIAQFSTCDVMINDVSLFCASALRDLLDIPRATFFSGLVPPTIHSWTYGIPLPLSYIPHIYTGLSQKMNFFQRVYNVIHFSLISTYFYHEMRATGNGFKKKYNIPYGRDYLESERDSDLLIIQTDFAINYARSLPPGAIAVGPLSPQPAQPLIDELNLFMTNAGPEGVVVVSFGSEAEASVMEGNVMEKMIKAFGQLKQHVLWKLKAQPKQTLPQNIKILPWIPQNDVLGHMNTRVFVTHVGHNGMFEAAYHSVPMVGVPLLFDQFDNVQMMKAAGLGVVVDIGSISADAFTATIERVLYDKSFRNNAIRVSRILKDRRRTPVQEAADHMEYLLRHSNTKHLRPGVLDIPWYQYFLLDVIGFLVVVVTIVLTIFLHLLRWIFGYCCRLKVKT